MITEFSAGLSGTPYSIAAGPDGALWFTEFGANRIGASRPAARSPSPIPTTFSGATGIAAGPDGNLWFTEILRQPRPDHSDGHDHRVLGRT